MTVWITEVATDDEGVRLAVKDNIDVEGLPTTCAHPAFSRVADRTAPAVKRLLDVGAVVAGKANLDQFATGLVGTRSPYGVVENPYVPGRIAGGSSSGSAAAVALGLADIGIATDTAGSGRVPAALCGLVGMKPTVGLVPVEGTVPACVSLDCVSVFTRTVADAAWSVWTMASPPARPVTSGTPVTPTGAFRIGVPRSEHLVDLDEDAMAAWDAAMKDLVGLGVTVELDVSAYLDAGALVYGPAFLPERFAAVGAFLAMHPDGADPSVAEIIGRGGTIDAATAASDRALLPELSARASAWWNDVDVLAVPTTGLAPSIAEVAADPIALNLRLGTWTAGANPLDLCAAAVPCGRRADGVPFGITFLGPAFADHAVLVAAARLTGEPDPPPPEWRHWTDVVVVGAHLEGQPLNWQLIERRAHLVRAARTAAHYRLVALPTEPPKPGLVRCCGDGGASIEIEVWRMPTDAFGSFVAGVPSPLTIGTVVLEDGTSVAGFLCESFAADGAPDITSFGGWRAYLNR